MCNTSRSSGSTIATVWKRTARLAAFMRFVFRRSGSLVGVYIGLVFAYGSLGIFKEHAEVETIKRILTGVVAASGLLHFYYDGFIWKVRERSTRESLGLTGGMASGGSAQFLPSWLSHGLKWVAVFVIPLTALWIGQSRGPVADAEQKSWVVADLPVGAMQRFDYAASLAREHRFDEAVEQFRIGLRFAPNDETAHDKLGNLFFDQSKFDEAATHFAQAARLAPRNADFHSDYGCALERLDRKDEASAEHKAALRLGPKSARVHYNYAMFLGRAGQIDSAITEFQTALKYNPKSAEAHYDLGSALGIKGDIEGAKMHYLMAQRLNPKRTAVYDDLGVLYLRQGQLAEGIAQLKEALRLEPNDTLAAENLRRAEERQANSQLSTSNPH